jgi:anti-sigma factor RsiW
MHEPVKEHLEEYLRGRSVPAVEGHLRQCDGCRKELEVMRAQSALFQALRAPGDVEPGAGFYARVMNRVETEARPSVWSLFGESLFAKRLAYASATALLLLGTVFVSSTAQTVDEMQPEAVLSGMSDPPPVTMDDPQKDREVVLVNLATYEQQDYQ